MQGVKPTAITLSLLVKQSANLDQAITGWKWCVQKGAVPDAQSFTELLRKSPTVSRMDTLLEWADKQKIPADKVTLGVLLHFAVNQKDTVAGKRFCDWAERRRIYLDYLCKSHLVDLAVATDDTDAAWRRYKRIRSSLSRERLRRFDCHDLTCGVALLMIADNLRRGDNGHRVVIITGRGIHSRQSHGKMKDYLRLHLATYVKGWSLEKDPWDLGTLIARRLKFQRW